MNANEMIQIVNQYLPDSIELIEQLLTSKAVTNDQPNVVVYGVYNAGKSSLLNSLTGHVEQEYFTTRDIPETKVSKSLVHDGLCYLDTPGLDVNAQDTQAALEGGYKADLIILVHKLGAGSIQKPDWDAMKKLVNAHGNNESVIAVLTEGETASHNRHLIEEITQQLRSMIPGCPSFIVSNTGFRKGVLEGKQALVHHSGIPQLLQQLQEKKRLLAPTLAEERANKQEKLKIKILQRLQNRHEYLELLSEDAESKRSEEELRCVAAVRAIQISLNHTSTEKTLISGAAVGTKFSTTPILLATVGSVVGASGVASVVGAAAAAAWGIKKFYGISSDDKNDHSNNAHNHSVEREKRLLRLKLLKTLKIRMIASELQQIQHAYLEPGPLPSNFDAAAINTFHKFDVNDKTSAEQALTVLCGQPIRIRTSESNTQVIQQEVQSLKKFEQFIHEI